MKKVLCLILCLLLGLGGLTVNAESSEPSSTGDGLMPYDDVLRLIRWISDGYYRNMTYREIVDFVGVEGLDCGHRDTSMTALGDHYFKWIAASDPTHFIHVCFRGRDDSGRFEACQWNTSGFSSSEWADVDLTDWLAQTASTETTETALQIQRFSNPLVTVTAQMPAAGWRAEAGSNSAYFYNERGEQQNDPRIEIVTFENTEMLEFYKDKWENLQPAESRVIAGVEMQGRTYHHIGWDWTEYYAKLSDDVSVGVRISRVNCNPGTEGSALLDSLKLNWTAKDGTEFAFPGSAAVKSPETEKPAPADTPEPTAAGTEPPVTPIPEKETAVPEIPVMTAGADDYTGIWYSTWMHTGGMEGDPRDQFGMTMILTLNADGTGEFDYFGSDGGGRWGTDEDGITRYWGEGTPLSILADGSLCWGSSLSGYILFSRDKTAEVGLFPQNPENGENDGNAGESKPAANDAGTVSAEFVGVKYVGKTYIAGGISMDASMLGGEYAILLNADGSAVFTMAGMETPGYSWKQTDDRIEVAAYGNNVMTLTEEADGSLLLDYNGAFTLVMEPQQ